MKNFFKPTVVKAILFLLLLIPTVFIPRRGSVCYMTPTGVSCSMVSKPGLGYPTFFGEDLHTGDNRTWSLNLTNLLVNIVAFYTVSSLIVFSFNRLKKKKQI
jgi:hypothetical protein